MSASGGMRTRDVVRAVVGFTLYVFLVPALLFIGAGTIDWPMGWVYVALLLACTLGSRLVLLKISPDTLRERARLTASEGTKAWDRALVVIVGLFGPMVMMLVAGLDHRFGWSAAVPQVAQWVAAAVTAAAYGLAVWAMIVNAFFSSVVRIQKDRGQVVVTTGPYSFVRHPSYAGALVACLSVPLMLDALWMLVPGLAMIAALVIRTRLEDRMLVEELAGYSSYAETTRYRLIPGIW
ncbi:MAG: isoprenylcysteine carboxylmethyltransferase family protein [Anaerolineales bacterium]|nr:MAG: isoprenylcysteine carboxylmethyltransferase family protein [Anaerolineales bacterium]